MIHIDFEAAQVKQDDGHPWAAALAEAEQVAHRAEVAGADWLHSYLGYLRLFYGEDA